MQKIYCLLLVLTYTLLTQASSSPPPTRRDVAQRAYWRLLYQNDADWGRADSAQQQVGYLLYSHRIKGSTANSTCAEANEQPVQIKSSKIESGLKKQLQYLIYDKSYKTGQRFWISNTQKGKTRCSILTVTSSSVKVGYTSCNSLLPVLCTQSAPRTIADDAIAAGDNSSYALTVNGLTAYRDAFSFRFLRLPFANTPQRFGYSSLYTGGSAGTSPTCPSPGGSTNEDCLVANVYTPIIAGVDAPLKTLKPIIVWAYGGGFTTGSGQDPVFDGGSLASRGDVVVVTPNYRLGSLGFLSIDGNHQGNYALSDLITALQWTKVNAHTFGGDPNRITVAGQSAGAQLVESLLASPAAAGLFHRAIVQSGRPADAANSIMTAAAAQAGPSGATIQSLGCANNADVVGCLQAVSVSNMVNTNPFAKQVIDGHLIVQPNLDVAQKRGGGFVNRVPVIWTHMRDEMASLGYAPPTSQQNLDAALSSAGITPGNRTTVEGNTDLFPVGTAFNAIQNLTVTVNTDLNTISRCGQEATIYSAASSNTFPALYAAVQDQRAYQIDWDPNGVCSGAKYITSGYLCHSGDLHPLFNTAGYAGQYPVRDSDDIIHSALMMDYWSSFAKTGNPNPSKAYMIARGYLSVASRIFGRTWAPTTADNMNFLSLGPYPSMIPLAQRGPQCSALGKPINYIATAQ